MAHDLEIRLLRRFVAVAEELHITRAARRLFLSQQALSRDLDRLETRVGTALLVRTTRRVELTAAGRSLLPAARELVASHDTLVSSLRGLRTAVTVDVVGSDLTPSLVLSRARHDAPDVEFFARFHTAPDPAVALLEAGELQVTFGRAIDLPKGVCQRVVRYERLSVLLPPRHRLAQLDQVPLAELRGADRPCFRSGSHATPGWEHAMRQLLDADQVEPSEFHPHVHGSAELARHLHDRQVPVLTLTTQPAVPDSALRPITEPTPYFPWSMIWRTDADPAAIAALHAAVDVLAATDNWTGTEANGWLPTPEATPGAGTSERILS